MPVAVIVDWDGPYNSFDDFKKAMKEWSTNERTLYMALGSHNIVRYIGMTESPQSRPNQHPKLRDPKNRTFYTGNIVTQGISGRLSRKHAPDLTIAEHMLIWSIRPELNTRLVCKVPDDCVSVFSRFFTADNNEVSHNPLPKFGTYILAGSSFSDSQCTPSSGVPGDHAPPCTGSRGTPCSSRGRRPTLPIITPFPASI